MSECEKTKDNISAYLSQQLGPEEATRLESHLQNCSECQGQVAFMRGFKKQLVQAEKTEYSADVHSRLLAALAAEKSDSAETPDQTAFIQGFKKMVSEAEKVEYPAEVHSRLTAALDQERAQSQNSKVVPLRASNRASRFSSRMVRYVAAAAILCVGGLGLTKMSYDSSTPDAVVSLVAHHDTCWDIAPSSGRDAQFNNWVEGMGQMPPTPAVSSEMVAYDQRECPAGEVRGGHLLYNKGEQRVSVYILPAEKFTASYGEALHDHTYEKKNVVLTKKGDWVYGVVAELPTEELRRLVDTDHVAMLRMFLAAQSGHAG